MSTFIPFCDKCQEVAEWQIGAYLPGKCRPFFYCTLHLPAQARAEIAKGNYTPLEQSVDAEEEPKETGHSAVRGK